MFFFIRWVNVPSVVIIISTPHLLHICKFYAALFSLNCRNPAMLPSRVIPLSLVDPILMKLRNNQVCVF